MVTVHVQLFMQIKFISLAKFPYSLLIFSYNLKCEIRNKSAGHSSHQRQISRLDKCKLKRVGDLQMDMFGATCTATKNEIIMCFPRFADKRCVKGATPFNITESVEKATHAHYETYIASSEHHALAVGDSVGTGIQNGVELLDLRTWSWIEKTPYPFEARISAAPIIYLKGRFFMFGGYGYHNGWTALNRIATYSPNTDNWSTEGRLLTPRFNHGVSVVNGGFVIVGGYMSGERHSEKCLLEANRYTCTYQNPSQPYSEYRLTLHIFIY